MNDNKTKHKEVSCELTVKVCDKCRNELPLTEFRFMNSKKWTSYYRGQCKKCKYEYQKKYLENKRKIKFSDSMEILIHRQFKVTKPELILDLSIMKILPVGTDEQFVKMMDYKNYWISNYGRMIHYINGEYALLTGGYDNYGVLRYSAIKNVLFDGKWIDRRVDVYAPRMVIETFIVNPDIKNNIYIWHSCHNKEDNYYRNLYPLNREQYRIVKQNFMKNGDDSEEFIIKVMNDMKYKPDDWSKSVLKPEMCGVGYHGSTDIDFSSNSYKRWHDMMHRCYNEKFHARQKRYYGCEVYEEWKNYSNFKIWYDNNYYTVGDEQMDLNKDILFKGNTVYSPETCCIVPHSINTLFVNAKERRGDLPIGVSFDKRDNKYYVSMSYCGRSIKLGRFDDKMSAFNEYKDYKEKFIKDIAERYDRKIPYKVYLAAMEWKIEIDD